MKLFRMVIDRVEKAIVFRDHKVLHTNLVDLIDNYKRQHNYFGSSVVLNVAERMNFWHRVFINKYKFTHKSVYSDSEVVCMALHTSYPEVFKDPDTANPEIYTSVETWVKKEFTMRMKIDLRISGSPTRRTDIAILRKVLAEYGNRPVVIRFKDFGY